MYFKLAAPRWPRFDDYKEIFTLGDLTDYMLLTSGKEFSTSLTCYTFFVSSISGAVYIFFHNANGVRWNQTTEFSKTKNGTSLRPSLHGSGQIFERKKTCMVYTGPAGTMQVFERQTVLQSATGFPRFRINEVSVNRLVVCFFFSRAHSLFFFLPKQLYDLPNGAHLSPAPQSTSLQGSEDLQKT